MLFCRFWSDLSEVNLEPTEGQIWARGISLIAPNTLAYAYQDGKWLGCESKFRVADQLCVHDATWVDASRSCE